MEYIALIIGVIAGIIAIMAYQKAGGAADLKKQAEVLSTLGDTIVKATDSLRERTADLLDKMEGAVRGKEEPKKQPPAGKKEAEDK